jgi:hypothetical protein
MRGSLAAAATARKLLHIIYWMLMNGEKYHSQGLDLETKPAA